MNQLKRVRNRKICINRTFLFTYVDLFSFSFAMLAVLKSWTFIRQSGSPIEMLVANIIIALCVVLVGLISIKCNILKFGNFKYCVFPIIYMLIKALYRYDNSINWADAGVSVILIACLYLLLDKQYQFRTYEMIKVLFVLFALLGIACYFAYVLSLPIPYKYVQYYALLTQPDARYADYLGIALYVSPRGLVRLCGPFNEPGLFGTFLGLILISDNVNLYKKSNIILFVAGFFTYSVAFVVFILSWWIYKYEKNWKIFILLSVILITIFVLPHIQFSNENIQILINRIINISDNRTTTSFNNFFCDFLKSKDVLLGIGEGYTALNVSSIKMVIVKFGVVGTFLYIFYIIMLSLKYSQKKTSNLIFIIIFLASIYQRPDVIAPVYFIILIGGLYNINGHEH